MVRSNKWLLILQSVCLNRGTILTITLQQFVVSKQRIFQYKSVKDQSLIFTAHAAYSSDSRFPLSRRTQSSKKTRKKPNKQTLFLIYPSVEARHLSRIHCNNPASNSEPRSSVKDGAEVTSKKEE